MIETAGSASSAASGPKQRSSFLLAFLWVLVAGVIYLLLLRARSSFLRDLCGGIALVLGGVALFAWMKDSFLGRRRSTWALLLLITCTLIVAVVAWNHVFYRYIKSSTYRDGNFRSIYHTKHAPLYGHGERPLQPFIVWPVLAATTTLALAVAFRRRLLDGRVSAWWFVLLQVVMTVGFSLSDGTRSLKPEGAQPLRTTIPAARNPIQSTKKYLGYWVGNMSTHTSRLAHYPTGFTIYREVLLKSLRLVRWRHWVSIMLVCVTPLALAGLARELGLERGAAQLGMLLFSTAMCVLLYTRADFAAPAVPLAAASLWLLLRGARAGEW